MLIEWGTKGPSKKYVKKDVSKEIHEKATQFINWLKEAEEEESSDEEDEVEVRSGDFLSFLLVLAHL